MPQPASSSALLIQRLNRALAPDYEVTRALGGGGMGFVYLARDRTLDRVVAIKAIRPELATEAAVSRFLREARVLGRIRHPNIIPVHRAGMADGLPYYVMEYVEGETLAERLQRRRMPEREAITTGRALLDALAAAHTAGVIHRDVKPANVFLAGGRVLLGDFGVARVDTTDPDAASTSGTIGTPAYMAPEQSAGGVATEQSDIYSAGMVIYEMLTGRRWTTAADPQTADWSGVPHRYRRALRRALAWDPEQRWNRASAFRRVLSPRYRVLRRVTVSGWLFALLVLVGVVVWASIRARLTQQLRVQGAAGVVEPRDLAILPPLVYGNSPQLENEADEIASAIDFHLSGIPQLRLAPMEFVRRLWSNASEVQREDEMGLCAALNSERCTGSSLRTIGGDTLEYSIHLVDSLGVESNLPAYRVAGRGAAEALARRSADWILEQLKPELKGMIRSASRLSESPEARRLFFAAEKDFYSGQPSRAISKYEQALALDTTFALARWHLIQAKRWQPGTRVDPQRDLERLAGAGPERLDVIDSLLVQAMLEPPGSTRIAAYRRVAERDRGEPLPWMLLGEELFHRGPLAGYLFDNAAVALWTAARADSLWAQPLQMLLWLHTRQGHEEDAQAYLQRLQTIASRSPAGEYTGLYTEWLGLAAAERFDSTRARVVRAGLAGAGRGASPIPDSLIRMPFAFDMPDVEAEYAGIAIAGGNLVTGYYGRFLADAVRGRGGEALAYLDSATALMDSDTAELHAAEWRVIPLALGVPLFGEAAGDVGRARLLELVRDSTTRVRAAWALALDAMSRGAMQQVKDWRDSLAAGSRDSTARRLVPMLDGILRAARGDSAGALELTRPLLDFDAHGRHGDPFARSVLHLLRASWRPASDTVNVERDLRWAENMDITGWPADQPQAVEVDWVLSVPASRRRADLAAARADFEDACAHLARVRRFWTHDLTAAIEELKRDVDAKWTAGKCEQ